MSAATADPSITVVIPTYNERENLPGLIPDILALGPNYRIIVVDDNSPDGTGAIADSLAAQHPGRIEVVHRPRKEGIGPAYIAGFQAALAQNPDYIATMDADHSHSPADLARLVERAKRADLVLGSRYVSGGKTRGWPWYRQAISRLGGIYARLVLGVPISDLTGGFKVYQRDALTALDLRAIESDGYVFQIETTYRLLQTGRHVVEEPITFTDRYAGKSKLSRRIVLEATFMVWRLRWERLRRSS
jgi:glycosyltransferase involved in cell wall biosynthesis